MQELGHEVFARYGHMGSVSRRWSWCVCCKLAVHCELVLAATLLWRGLSPWMHLCPHQQCPPCLGASTIHLFSCTILFLLNPSPDPSVFALRQLVHTFPSFPPSPVPTCSLQPLTDPARICFYSPDPARILHSLDPAHLRFYSPAHYVAAFAAAHAPAAVPEGCTTPACGRCHTLEGQHHRLLGHLLPPRGPCYQHRSHRPLALLLRRECHCCFP